MALDIRTQLLVIVLLVSTSFFIQVSLSQVAQDNTDYILERETELLNRDTVISAQLQDIFSGVKDTINTKLEDFLYTLINNDRNFASIRVDQLLNSLSTTLDLLQTRQTEQYKLDLDKLFQLPLIGEFNATLLNQTNNIVDTSTTGIYQVLIDSYNQLSTELDAGNIFSGQLIANYTQSANKLENSSLELSSSINDLYQEVNNLATDIENTGNTTYIVDTLGSMRNIQNTTFSLQQVLTDFGTDLNFNKEIYGAASSSILDYYATRIDNAMTTLTTELETLNSSLLPSESGSFTTIMSTFSVLQAKDTTFDTAVTTFVTYYIAISDFESVHFISHLDDLSLNIEGSLFELDQENQQFQTTYGQILTYERQATDQLFNTISALIAIIVLGVIIITVWRMRSLIGRMEKIFKRLGKGDLTIKRPRSFSDNEFGRIERELFVFVDNFRETIKQIQGSSDYLADISEELAAGTEESSASMTEISHTLNTITSGTSQQEYMIDQIVSELNKLIKLVNETSVEITNASYVVRKISNRTNILGLNAAISASKAGEFASGFGIVAEEVRELAKNSKGSAEDISELISRINSSIKTTLDGIQKSVIDIKEVSTRTNKGAEASSTSASDQEIMISEISDTSNNLADLANQLNLLIQEFKVE